MRKWRQEQKRRLELHKKDPQKYEKSIQKAEAYRESNRRKNQSSNVKKLLPEGYEIYALKHYILTKKHIDAIKSELEEGELLKVIINTAFTDGGDMKKNHFVFNGKFGYKISEEEGEPHEIKFPMVYIIQRHREKGKYNFYYILCSRIDDTTTRSLLNTVTEEEESNIEIEDNSEKLLGKIAAESMMALEKDLRNALAPLEVEPEYDVKRPLKGRFQQECKKNSTIDSSVPCDLEAHLQHDLVRGDCERLRNERSQILDYIGLNYHLLWYATLRVPYHHVFELRRRWLQQHNRFPQCFLRTFCASIFCDAFTQFGRRKQYVLRHLLIDGQDIAAPFQCLYYVRDDMRAKRFIIRVISAIDKDNLRDFLASTSDVELKRGYMDLITHQGKEWWYLLQKKAPCGEEHSFAVYASEEDVREEAASELDSFWDVYESYIANILEYGISNLDTMPIFFIDRT